MSQSDFDFFSNGSSIIGGVQGAARLHTSLSNSASSHGLFCREFLASSGTNAISALVKSSVQSGKYYEIPNGKSISIRAIIRSEDVSVATNSVGFGGKLYSGSPESTSHIPRGYSVMIGDANQTGASSAIRFFADAGGTVFSQSIGINAGDNTWHKLRLDITPSADIPTPNDLIEIFTAPVDSDTWTSQYTRTILTTDPYYIPWGQVGNGRVGFWHVSSGTTISKYIDSFEVFVDDAF